MLKKVQKKPLVIQRISSELPGKYFSSGVNVLTNGLKMSDISKKDIFQLKFSQTDEES